MLALFTNRLLLWFVGGGAIVAALVLALNLGKAHGTIRGLKKDLVTQEEGWSTCRSDLSKSEAEAAGLRGTVLELDAANQRLIADSDRLQRDLDAKVAAARKQVERYRREADAIRTAKVDGDQCQWAQDFHVRILTEERQ